MVYNAREFIIPTDVKLGMSWGQLTELLDTNFSTIKEAYNKLKEDSDGI